ncbi:MAG TPA: hypothetical protein VNI57_02710 [Candidatus Saccharimonadales bacterium]|nr:hypothetical protein [Candidatus Saccharimonadales bacterium]
MQKQRRYLGLTPVIVPAIIVLAGAGFVRAAANDGDSNPWSRVQYRSDGSIRSAQGRDSRGVQLEIESTISKSAGRLTTHTLFREGREALNIQRTYDGPASMTAVYEAGDEKLIVSIDLDDLTGEALVVYRLPDGEVFSLWIAKEGDLLSGDLAGLRRALRQPMGVTRLLSSYVRSRGPLESRLPAAGEMLLLPNRACVEECSYGCKKQCAFECALVGPCQICTTACAIGCLIGCNPS